MCVVCGNLDFFSFIYEDQFIFSLSPLRGNGKCVKLQLSPLHRTIFADITSKFPLKTVQILTTIYNHDGETIFAKRAWICKIPRFLSCSLEFAEFALCWYFTCIFTDSYKIIICDKISVGIREGYRELWFANHRSLHHKLAEWKLASMLPHPSWNI